MEDIKKKNFSISVLIFLLLIFLVYLKQGTIIYKILIILVLTANLFLIDLNKTIKKIKFFFKKKINLIIFLLILILFSKNVYAFQIFVSFIVAYFLYYNFKNLELSHKKNLIFFLSILSIINYYLLGFLLLKFSHGSYFFNYDIISNVTNYEVFKGINFHNISFLYFGIFFLKLKYHRFGLQKFKNFYLISLLHDFLFILSLSYNSLIILSLIIIFSFSILRLIRFENFDKFLFILVIILSFNYLISPLILNKIFYLNIPTYFEKINYFIDFLKDYYSLLIDNDNNIPRLDLIKKSLGEVYVSSQGVFDRFFLYWSQDNYQISIFGSWEYNNFLYHSLFLEFLSNFGVVGLTFLYFYLFKFFSCLNTIYSKLFFLIVVLLNTMDTFMFSHHYQLMIITWIFIGILDEEKKI